jgi:hypothetical protein
MTNAITRQLVIAAFLVGALGSVATAQSSSSTLLGTVQIGRSLMANGQRLLPRLLSSATFHRGGQSGRWTAGRSVGRLRARRKVVGRELAGESRVEMLKEGQ